MDVENKLLEDSQIEYNEAKDITGNTIQVGDMILYPMKEDNQRIAILKRGIVVFINTVQNKIWFYEEHGFDKMPYVMSGEYTTSCVYIMERIGEYEWKERGKNGTKGNLIDLD
jgi:hypothetical protein